MKTSVTTSLAIGGIFTLLLGVVVADDFATRHKKHLGKRAVPDLNPNTISTGNVEQIADKSYDYIVVGGGTAGLAVAARLSENSNDTIAVIEGGGTGDDVMQRVLVPAMAYYQGIAGPTSEYDWQYYTSNQTELGNRPVFWPRGKLLGGSSASNGVYMTPGSRREHDSWASLYNNGTAWDWDHIEPYYRRHQTFEPPTEEYSHNAGGIVVDEASHGYDGPIHYSRAGYFFQQIAEWIPTWANLGVPTLDQASGVTTGAYLSTSAIRTSDQTRSYSRVGYFPSPRSNVDILTGFTVTRVNTASRNGNVTATGVSFSASAGATTYNVQASREVILAAGVIGSPHILQLSGIGPSDLLQANGVDVVIDLPGVGAHLQDHVSTAIVFSTTAEVTGDLAKNDTGFASEQMQLWEQGNGNQSLYSAPNQAIAYANLTTVLGETAGQTYINQVRNNMSAAVDMYGLAGTVAAGYRAIYEAELSHLIEQGEPEVEFLMANTGWNGGASGKTVTLQFALQHPFSRGALRITSSDPFTMPSIDPGYLTHPGDIAVMREAFKYLRRVAQTAPLSGIIGSEISPGTETVSSDDDASIEGYIRRSASTEYHPAGGCAMLPLELGGVVDEQARVHGVANLRVIDSSVIPIGLAAHLCSPTYAIAELGAAMIKGEQLLVRSGSGSTSNGATGGSGAGSSNPSATSGVGPNANSNDSSASRSTMVTALTAALLPTVFALLILS